MANNVGTPRFYVSWGDYWKSLGTTVHKLHTLNPSQEPTDFYMNSAATHRFYSSSIPYPTACKGINFYAVLGHNIANYPDATQYFAMKQQVDGDGETQEDFLHINTSHFAAINTGTGATPEYNGFSIGILDNPSDHYVSGHPTMNTGIRKTSNEGGLHINNENRAKISSFVFGQTYDMPHSPDLSLKLSVEMDGIRNIQTKGGATLSNTIFNKPSDWGEYGAWQLGNNPNYRNGRRSWDLSFSYLSDTDIMPENGITSNATGTTEPNFDTNILDGTDFFSSVWNKTAGLPFIFQADNTNNNPDAFAIARFDQSSLQYEQVAHNTYNVKLKIRESW